ncbi:MAG: IS1595 family transposase [bacterium]|nr:IS1595 family transposase [bacterium]
MSQENSFYELVNSLNVDQLLSLEKEIRFRKFKIKLGANNFNDLALKFQREPVCPKCQSHNYIKFGNNKKGEQRYQCKDCKTVYNLLSSSIFNSIKNDLPTFYNFIVLLTYNVPLDMVEEILCISRPTALLWRHKIFETVEHYQNKTKLKERVWIDEIFVDDPEQLLLNGSIVGLSRNKICIAIAIDVYKCVFAKIIGHGKPNKDKIYNAFKDAIEPKSILVHDADRSHEKLIKMLSLKEEYHKASIIDDEYKEKMNMINSLSSWIKRFVYRYIGMKTKNLQRYLNWYVYLFQVKQGNEKWPKNERILRHLLIDETKFVGIYKKKKAN